MLGDSSSVLGSSGDAGAVPVAAEAASASAAAAAPPPHEGGEVGGVVGSNSGEEDRGRVEDGDRSFGGNRWPRQETLALLKIRSDMDVTFRDASVKGPLWEDVSRKLAELGFHRNAKKCKEKFENVYKYHKRTKEGRTGKSDGKTYRFFDQLQALENLPSLHSPTATLPKPAAPTVSKAVAMAVGNPPSVPQITTAPSTTHTMNQGQGIVTPTTNLTMNPTFPPTNPTILPIPPPPTATNNPPQIKINPSSFQNISADLISNSTSSSTSSDEQLEGRNKRKRKWKDFFERLMMEVIEKQEELQNKFLEAIEKREHERMAREEAWRVQEMARINREREILAQERSIAAAKDAAVMAFLQKISDQHPNPAAAQALNNLTQPALPTPPQLLPPPPPRSQPQPSAPSPLPIQPAAVACLEISTTDNGENFTQMSSSRWPKVEVQALINLRTSLDSKYQENGPKGPLWEEISAAMKKIGYNRSSKRCKEKWENINKYFKKVKESNKKRPEDSKTCPYFHQLDAIYRERNKFDTSTPNQIKPENTMVPIMVQPEQQWPPQREINQTDAAMESDPMDQTQEDDEDDKDEDEEEEDEEGGNNYEIVASKPLPAASVGAAE